MNKTETIQPKDRQHWLEMKTKDISSTESAALFGMSPYTTEFELWHRKKEATIVELDPNARMTWGTRLQDAIAHGVAEDQGWRIRKMDEYIRDPDLRMGSSFDFMIGDDALLEVKNVDALQFRDGWMIGEDGEIEAPTHIEIQVQHQLEVSGKDVAFIAALVGGNSVKLIERERDKTVIDQIKARIEKFWKLIEQNTPPQPDFERDSKFIASLYQNSTEGAVLDARSDMSMFHLMNEYRAFSDAEKQAKMGKDAIKARILMEAQDASKIIGHGFSISMGMVKGCDVSFTREPYRMFKPTFKKTIE